MNRLLAASLVILGSVGTPVVAQTTGVTEKEIRIGSFGPLTGTNFVFGRMPMNGVEAVFAKVNEAGGIHGRKLVFVRQDDQCDPAATIAAVRKLISSENVFAIVGGSCSNTVLAAKPDIIEAKIPFVNFAAASNLISAPKVDNIFTTMLTSVLESKLQAAYLRDKGVKKIAIISIPDAWGRDRHGALILAAKENAIEIVSDEEMSVDTNDATAQVLKAQASKADHVVMLTYPKPSAIYLRDAARLGFKANFIATSTIPDPVAFYSQVAVPGATDNFMTISPLKYSISDKEVADWKDRILKMFPNDKEHGYNLYGIGAGQIVVDALNRAGPNLTREGFIKAMESTVGLSIDVYPASVNCSTHQCLQTAAWVRRKPDGSPEIMGFSTLK